MADTLAFVRRIIHRSFSQVRGDWRGFAMAFIVVAIPGILVDSLLSDREAVVASLPLGLFTAYVQLLLTFRTLHANGAAPPGYQTRDLTEARLPSVIAAGIFETLAVLLGLLLFVVPGIALMLLWSLTIPVLAAERLGATDAMRRSWGLARHALGRLLAIGMIFVLVVALAALMTAIIEVSIGEALWAYLLLGDVMLPIVTLFSAIVWTHAYLDLRTSEGPRNAPVYDD